VLFPAGRGLPSNVTIFIGPSFGRRMPLSK